MKALALVLAAALAAALPAPAQEIAYEKYVLENGMSVILHEDHRLPVACVNLWYFVGSKDEPAGRSGFAHLFEHLMFMGTERVPGSGFDEIMEGGGGWNNASTGTDRTNYYSFGPTELLPSLLWLDADRLEDLGRMMNQEKLDRQREVVRNERRQGTEMQPYGEAELEITKLMYPPGHPYHIDVIGTHEDLRAATVRDVKEFFDRYYVPNNASLVVAGDFDPAEIKPIVARLFGTIPRAPDPPHAEADPVVLTEEKRVTYSDDVQFGRLYLVYHSPPLFAPGDAEMDLAAQILGSGKSSRLYKALVMEEKLATDVDVYQDSRILGSLFHVIVTARQGVSLDDVEAAADDVLDRFAREGPDEEELERQKAAWEHGMLSGLQSVLRKADALNRYNYFLGEPNGFREDLDRYRDAGVEDVRRRAGELLRPDARLVMRVLPETEAALLAGRDERPEAGPPGEFRLEPPERFALSNGIEVWHWRRSDLPLVQLSFLIEAGSVRADALRSGTAWMITDMLDEGAGERDVVAFTDALDLLGARFSAWARREYSLVELSALKRNFDESMKLFADGLLRPRFEETEWERVKRIHLEELHRAEDRPSAVAARVGMRAFFGDDHPFGKPVEGTVEEIEALTLDEVVAAYGRLFVPGNTKIFIAGDLTAGEARGTLEKTFGDWKNPPGFGPAERIDLPPPANGGLRVVLVDVPDAVQTVIRIHMNGPTYGDPNRIRYELFNTILGGSFTSRLNRNLREEHGYTYGARSSFVMGSTAGTFVATSSVQAEVTGAALGEFLHEFDRIRGGDITDEEAKKARGSFRMDTIDSFESLTGLLWTAEERVRNGLSFEGLAGDLAAMDSVGSAELNTLSGRALPADKALIVLVGDRETVLEQIAGLDLPAPDELTADGDPR